MISPIEELIYRLNIKAIINHLTTYAILTAATAIMVCGIYIFKFPNNFSFGGVSGMVVVSSKVTPFSAGTINFVITILHHWMKRSTAIYSTVDVTAMEIMAFTIEGVKKRLC